MNLKQYEDKQVALDKYHAYLVSEVERELKSMLKHLNNYHIDELEDIMARLNIENWYNDND